MFKASGWNWMAWSVCLGSSFFGVSRNLMFVSIGFRLQALGFRL